MSEGSTLENVEWRERSMGKPKRTLISECGIVAPAALDVPLCKPDREGAPATQGGTDAPGVPAVLAALCSALLFFAGFDAPSQVPMPRATLYGLENVERGGTAGGLLRAPDGAPAACGREGVLDAPTLPPASGGD